MSWKGDGQEYRSDVKDVAGDDPAVFGFDLGHLELRNLQNLDRVIFQEMKRLIPNAYKKGGIVTLSWHADNPTSGGSTWDTTATVKYILKGGLLHTPFKAWLFRIADFMNNLKDRSGNPIPVWRETVDILFKEFNVHNLLYAYSPNGLNDPSDYLRFYPGEDYVDIFGIDIYQHGTTEDFVKQLDSDITLLKKIATEKKKPYALTEVVLNQIPIANWWTQVLDKQLENTGIAWALFWRNAWPNHYYAPYPGQISSEDFKQL